MPKWYKEYDDPQPFGLPEMPVFDATKASHHNMPCPTCGKEKSVCIDELKPGSETDGLISELLDMQWDVDDGNNPYWIDGKAEFQPSTDLNAAFWAAEQAGLFSIPGFSCELVKIGNLWNLRKGRGRWVLDDSAETPALAICKAILKLKAEEKMDTPTIRTVADLISVLRECPQNLPIATHAFGYNYSYDANRESHGPLRVGLLATCAGDHVIIGDIMYTTMKVPSEKIKEMFDGGPDLPDRPEKHYTPRS